MLTFCQSNKHVVSQLISIINIKDNMQMLVVCLKKHEHKLVQSEKERNSIIV